MPIRHLSELNPYDNNRLKKPHDSAHAGNEKNTLMAKKENPAVAPTKSVRYYANKARALYPSEGQSIAPKPRPK